ncbi:MAG TPA: PilZ domain-containing protein [Nitrospirota bacterium]
MQDKRRHKRFKLDLMDINGRMIAAHKVELIDISLGGVALKTDKRLYLGKEYLLKLKNKGKSIDIKGNIVRCELTGIEATGNGEGASIYTAGMMFKDTASNTIAAFINSIEKDKKEAVPATVDRRFDVRFYITAPGEKTLSFPAQFKVKDISLSGMLIRTEQTLGIESMIPMGLSLQEADNPINFTGRVVSCRMVEDKGQARMMNNEGQGGYEIGVEFKSLTDKDRMLLKAFIEYLVVMEAKTSGKKTGN